MITAKLLLREVWRHNIGWDNILPDEIFNVWNNWRQELKNVIDVKVPRNYFGNGVPNRLELYVFIDASKDAFGGVSYWRSINSDEKIEVSFVAAKTRCAPLKTMSIPRLKVSGCCFRHSIDEHNFEGAFHQGVSNYLLERFDDSN